MNDVLEILCGENIKEGLTALDKRYGLSGMEDAEPEYGDIHPNEKAFVLTSNPD